MDTSDSEYFESADEEVYLQDEIENKSNLVLTETKKDLINFNLVKSCLNQTEEPGGNIDDTLNNVNTSKEKPSNFDSDKRGDLIVYDNSVHELNLNQSVNKKSLTSIDSGSTSLIRNDQTYLDNNAKCINLNNCNADTDSNNPSSQVSSELKYIHSVSSIKTVSKTTDTDCISTVDETSQSIKTDNLKLCNEKSMCHSDDWEAVKHENSIKEIDDTKIDEYWKENMWHNDDWESVEAVEPEKSCPSSESTQSSWSNWGGVSSIFTTATQGVSSFTVQMSQGLSSVLETSMGIPDPKELAKLDMEQQKSRGEDHEVVKNNSNIGFGFGSLSSNLVSGVTQITKFMENTGSKVITGGLDTLETIGKKTVQVLQEGDPGLKNKRALLKLGNEKPILSQVLREAKGKAEREKHVMKKMNYETIFDNNHGIVHLEALEMLSKQCEIKLQTRSENCSRNEVRELQETMDQIKELCELPDEDDEETTTFSSIKEKLKLAIQDLNVNISYNKLISLWENTEVWLNNLNLNFCDEDEIHQEAVQVLAQLTAFAVEQFHKCGELLLIKDHRSTADEAESLVQLTMALTSFVGLAAATFSEKLTIKCVQTADKELTNTLITNIFFEAENSSRYVQDAFQLLIPVLQIAAV